MLSVLKKLYREPEKKKHVSQKRRDYLPLEIKEALLSTLRLNTASNWALKVLEPKTERNAGALMKTQTFEEQAQHPLTHTQTQHTQADLHVSNLLRSSTARQMCKTSPLVTKESVTKRGSES